MARSQAGHPNQGFLARAHKLAFFLTVGYAVVILTLAHPWVQRHVAYQHAIVEPFRGQYDLPEKYGLARELLFTLIAGKTRGMWDRYE